nr:MAG TPA: RNA polymerase inhibitor [Caudoviricetes sp.]
MKKYIVSGKVTAYIEVELEAENKKEAIKKAYQECSGPMNFVGNGGCDKLIGVCDTDNADVSIACDDEVEYTEVEEIE